MKSIFFPLLVGGLLAASFTTSAKGLSLGQRKFAKSQNQYFARSSVKPFKKKCGFEVEASIDWDSFQEQVQLKLDGKLNHSFYGFCGAALDAMFSMCGDEDSKNAIKNRIQVYTCKYGGKGKRKIELRGNTLTMWVDWKAPNYGPFVKKYLESQL